MIPKDIVT